MIKTWSHTTFLRMPRVLAYRISKIHDEDACEEIIPNTIWWSICVKSTVANSLHQATSSSLDKPKVEIM